MRRWIALLLALALIPMGIAVAASETVPPLEEIATEETAPGEEDADGSAAVTEGELAVVDPVTGEVTYPYWMEQTDGSETLFFMLIDSMNDEATLVEEHGSLTIRMDYVGPDGTIYLTVYETLFDAEFGKGMLAYADGHPERVYAFADRTAVFNGDDVTIEEPNFPPDEFEYVWMNQYYPIASEEVLHAMAVGTDGFTYMRTSGMYAEDATGELEYQLEDGFRLARVKVYSPDEAGEPVLSVVITYSVGDPVELPDSVAQALREA